MINFHEIVCTDHLGIMVNIDLDSYFNVQTSVSDNRKYVRLDPRRKNHVSWLCEKVEEMVEVVQLEKMIDNLDVEDSPNF